MTERDGERFPCQVLVPGLPKPLTYAVPVQLEPGILLVLPMRRRLRCGWLLRMEESWPDDFEVKDAIAPWLPPEAIPDLCQHARSPDPMRWLWSNPYHQRLPDALWETLRWAAAYYQQPFNRFVHQFLPDERIPDLQDGYLLIAPESCPKEVRDQALVKHGVLWIESGKFDDERREAAPPGTWLRWPLPAGRMHDDNRFRATPGFAARKVTGKLAEARQLLSREKGASPGELKILYRDPRAAIRRALRQGDVTHLQETETPSPLTFPDAPVLTPVQQEVLDNILKVAQRGFAPVLLYGATGSGKTEIFLRLASALLPSGKQILLLAPEIGIATQLAARIEQRIPGHVLLFHSALGVERRNETLRRAQAGEPVMLIGARSALSVPLPKLGAIIVDEEHENSYKSPEYPYLNGRDMALVLGRKAQVPVVLASATPSPQSWQRSRQGDYERELLPRSFSGGNSRFHCYTAGGRDPLPGFLKKHIAEALTRGEQVAILKNRRGRYRQIRCRRCGHFLECPECDLPLVQHQHPAPHLLCHACGHRRPQPERCPACDKSGLVHSRPGTQRWQEYLQKNFADSTIVRIDSDSTGGVEGWLQLYNQVREGHSQILIGTQMLAKGFDFPNLHTMIITGVDTMLAFPKVRAWEQTASLLVQAGGRTGRRATQGNVWIETSQTEHPVIRAALSGDYAGFLDAELARRKRTGFPPFRRALRLSIETPEPPSLENLCTDLTAIARAFPALQLLPPTEEDVNKRRGKWRSEALILSSSSSELHRFATRLTSEFSVRVFCDFDPVEY